MESGQRKRLFRLKSLVREDDLTIFVVIGVYVYLVLQMFVLMVVSNLLAGRPLLSDILRIDMRR